MFRPTNNLCIDCGKKVDIHHDRHYIIWDTTNSVYRRRCAGCDDTLANRPYERSHSSDAVLARMSNEGDTDD